MNGCENSHTGNSGLYFRCNEGTLLKHTSTVDDAMTHDVNFRSLSDYSRLSTPKGLEHVRNHFCPGVRGQVLFDDSTARIADFQFRGSLVIRPILISLPERCGCNGRQFSSARQFI